MVLLLLFLKERCVLIPQEFILLQELINLFLLLQDDTGQFFGLSMKLPNHVHMDIPNGPIQIFSKTTHMMLQFLSDHVLEIGRHFGRGSLTGMSGCRGGGEGRTRRSTVGRGTVAALVMLATTAADRVDVSNLRW